MRWFRPTPPLFFKNARLFDPILGETHGSLRIVNGLIAGIHTAPERDDMQINLDGAILMPAFVNAHDHLELDNFPRWKSRPCYANAREWAMEANAQLDTAPEIVAARRIPLTDRLLLGGLKNLLSGATIVAHHNPYHAPLRARNYPVQVVSRYGWSHSLYLSPEFAAAYRKTPANAPYMIHLAEGTDNEAHGELDKLDDAGALADNTVLIHGVGLTLSQRAYAIARRAALVWCPASNFFLLDATATVTEFSDAHRLALGSDSRLTGGRDLLDEARFALGTGQITPAALLRVLTYDAAQILRLDNIGRLTQGMRADLVLLPNTCASATDAIGKLNRADLGAVIRNGAFQVADPAFAAYMQKPVPATLDGRPKIITPDLTSQIRAASISEPGLVLS